MAEIFVWHPLSPFIYVTLSATHCFSLLTPCSSSAIPEGPKSFLVSSRAVWWRTTRSAPRRSSSWSTPSSETNPTRGKSAFSSKTTSTVPRRRGERRVRMSLSVSFLFNITENLETFQICVLLKFLNSEWFLFLMQMRQSMSIVAVRRKKRIPQSRRESPGMVH